MYPARHQRRSRTLTGGQSTGIVSMAWLVLVLRTRGAGQVWSLVVPVRPAALAGAPIHFHPPPPDHEWVVGTMPKFRSHGCRPALAPWRLAVPAQARMGWRAASSRCRRERQAGMAAGLKTVMDEHSKFAFYEPPYGIEP